jgi:prolyl oligopeptidase
MRIKSKIILFVNVFLLFLFLYYRSFAQTFNYPATPKQPVSDNIFGKVVVDDFRWMEDVSSSQMQDWLKAQVSLTNDWLDKIPARNALIEEYKKLDQITSNDLSLFIIREGGRYFYQKTLAGENVAKLYYRQGKNGKEVLLFDPHTYSNSQTKQVTFYFVPSKDGKKVALNITGTGKSDISSLKVINVDTKQFYSDTLSPGTSVQAWSPDSAGFLYSMLQTTDALSTKLLQDISVKYHRLGMAVSDDKVVLSRVNNPNLSIKGAELLIVNYSPDNKYLLATLWSGFQDENRSLFASASGLEKNNIDWKILANTEDQVRDAIIYKEKVYLVSRKDAPNFKILVSPLNKIDIPNAQTLLPESKQPIGWVRITRDYLLIQNTEGTNTYWKQYNFSSGKIQPIKLPYDGAPWIYSVDITSNDCIINVLSWKQPITRYDYNIQSHKTTISSFNTRPKYPGTDDLIVEELEVKGHDGVMIPLSLFYSKHIKKDGKNIVYMTGYGSYGNGVIQSFNLLFLPLLNKGVIIAVTHPRGGGEKGYAWHMGGFKATKPNTWKDFISCGEYLITNRYTSAEHLIGEGTSAGGILIGRAITERPDLFAAAINNVPVSNPLRGENRPNGTLDSKEFGTVKDSTEAMGLIEMDAYLHVAPGVKYPAVIAVGGINDIFVPIWQPAKFVAALQNANSSSKPILLLVNYDIGHGTEEKNLTYRNFANQIAFALWQAGHNDFQPLQHNP